MSYKKIYLVFTVLYFVFNTAALNRFTAKFEKEEVRKVLNSVTSWQIKAYPTMDENRFWKSHGDLSWENGVFLSALASWAEFDKNQVFIDWYTQIANKNFWQLNGKQNRIYFADDLIVALMYAELYDK